MTQFKSDITGGQNAPTSNANQISNNFNTALKSLQSSIDKLNQNVSRLASNGLQAKQAMSANGRQGGYLPISIAGSTGLVGSFTEKAVQNEVKDAVLNALKANAADAWTA